ncbi:energy-coupled thiamine transporter ThiT [Zongyangia hominis]|uniref:Energy-coupled thiamine transporter ThiT n=1 Tax=Zongyangia hominis TaxID=2763677 RepID=A0A926ECA6_9FIRM|nr:energy-coupled thiamine transporter ThiT [Zongyangia hominis]MBC8569734.1 energy-coupled thiamine transporter ThiT [Zongyangia hominis]
MGQFRTRRMVESALFIAMTAVLYIIKIFQLPYGGAVTLVSMLPLLILSYRYGVKWGMFSGFVCGILLMLVDAAGGIFKGASLGATLGTVALDYLAAFAVLGLSGLFRGKTKRPATDLVLGAVAAGLIRYVVHVISGFIFFGSYAEWFFSQDGFTLGSQILGRYTGALLSAIYSAVYNATFMAPEIILTAIAAGILGAALKDRLTADVRK